MRLLRDLLATWDDWSAREVLIHAFAKAPTDHARAVLDRSLAEASKIDPLDVLRDSSELIALVQGQQWQAVYAARRAGASWDDIAEATGATTDQARATYAATVERQERYGITDASEYLEVL